MEKWGKEGVVIGMVGKGRGNEGREGAIIWKKSGENFYESE